MKNYAQLVNFEINRFAKLYIWLAVVIFLIQTVAVAIISKMFMSSVEEQMQEGAKQAEVLDAQDPYSLSEATMSFGFFVPIALGIVALLFYMFFIWYRDWFAKSAFIYRLLTLPTARINVFFAKITTIMLSVFGLIAMQLIVLKLCSYIITWMVPVTFRGSTSVVQAIHTSPYLNIFYPSGFPEFLIAYGIGFSFVVVVFTVILLERSFRLKGLMLGILYVVVSFIICLGPLLTEFIFGLRLYEAEFFMVQLIVFVIVTGASIFFSRYLLHHKIMI